MTQAINALSWQEQSDPAQPLANYTVNFALDPVWQFRLSTAMYHFQSINPAGITIDNSNGGGTITLQSAAFTVNILPFSREDIDLSNASQQLTLTYIGASQSPSVAPYSLPVVFWIKKPSGAQQNQLAINQAVQSALISTVLGNMQPIINSGFTEFPQGNGATPGAGASYAGEGWMVSCAGALELSWQQNVNPGFPAPFGFQVGRTVFSALTSSINFGTALTSADSRQFQGSQITFAVDVVRGANMGNVPLTISIVGGQGTDQNIFAPFTLSQVLATAPFTGQGRVSLTTAAAVPTNISQIGILFSYQPIGVGQLNEFVQISRPQLDFGTIVQQFRTVPQLMEKDRCLSFFEVLNSEGVANYMYAMGTSNVGNEVTTPLQYKRKRAIPSFVFTANNTFIESGGGNACTGMSCRNIGQDRALLAYATAGGMGLNIPRPIQDNGAGTSSIAINARM